MDQITNRMRLEAQRVVDSKAKTRIGIIDSYDQGSYSIKVRLQPDNTITGWMPLGTLAAGPGWGFMIGPTLGQQIEVEFQEDGHEVPVGGLRFHDVVNSPSANGQVGPPAGEWWMVHESGSQFKFTNDGKLLLASGQEIDIGNLASAFFTLATSSILSKFNNHTHTSAASGSPTSAPLAPNQLAASDFTTVLKAN